jgi:zinc D-Ala-D-Ala carboxypeptidase
MHTRSRSGVTAVAAFVAAVLAACSPAPPPTVPGSPLGAAPAPMPGVRPVAAACLLQGWREAARANAGSLHTLAWAPFGRPETGWEIYLPLIQHEIATACPPDSEGFAAALARWQTANGLGGEGVLTEPVFLAMKRVVQTRRAFVRFTAEGDCPETPDLITAARPDEGLGGKPVWLQPRALAAYRLMAAAARAEVPEIAADPDGLKIFSGYRSPSADAARCVAEGNCDGLVRARCSPHRTGLAADIYVGHLPGFTADSTADANRLHMTRTAAYLWLVRNAGRFGFVNYVFEPWHWEWTGEPPSP